MTSKEIHGQCYLALYAYVYFSLAAVNKSLVLVGGKDRKTTKSMDILGCGLLKHKGGVTPIRQCLLLIVRQLWLLIETGG